MIRSVRLLPDSESQSALRREGTGGIYDEISYGPKSEYGAIPLTTKEVR